MQKSLGIVGQTGRMGILLADVITHHSQFNLGIGFSRSQKPFVPLEEVFKQNDYVIDFSKAELILALLNAAIAHPKPLLICTTGWSKQAMQQHLQQLSAKVPVIIASNTSIGAYLQRYLVKQLAKLLGEEFDIDIMEKHHRYKIDSPSGTATSLLEDVQEAKQQQHGVNYQNYHLDKGPRPDHFIGMAEMRSGNLPGDHEVTFTSAEEMISVRHVAFNRILFAKGALKAIEWLDKTKPAAGIYDMADVLNLR